MWLNFKVWNTIKQKEIAIKFKLKLSFHLIISQNQNLTELFFKKLIFTEIKVDFHRIKFELN